VGQAQHPNILDVDVAGTEGMGTERNASNQTPHRQVAARKQAHLLTPSLPTSPGGKGLVAGSSGLRRSSAAATRGDNVAARARSGNTLDRETREGVQALSALSQNKKPEQEPAAKRAKM
jgi:hypothetical protein